MKPFISICSSSTRSNCSILCPLVHFNRSLRPQTDVSLGDCSYLNTCHRIESCRYVHWELEEPALPLSVSPPLAEDKTAGKVREVEAPPLPLSVSLPLEEEKAAGEEREEMRAEWLNVDLRSFDVSVLGKFDVVLADPPWAIHQDLPCTSFPLSAHGAADIYFMKSTDENGLGTLTDEEMLRMPVGDLQLEGGLIFLWVTGRAMELGRSCLDAWGYDRLDEIIWVKMNQLQGLIRTGRTGHWLNHSKEHCLVAIRRPPPARNSPPKLPARLQKRLNYSRKDTQVILAEVRETSRKPDELYAIIERLFCAPSGGGEDFTNPGEEASSDQPVRMVELFGRQHNTRPGWLTLGNQFGSVGSNCTTETAKDHQIFEPDIVKAYNLRYPGSPISLSQ